MGTNAYMTDKELKKLAGEFTKGLTNGNVDSKCFMVSWPLSCYLSILGIENELVEYEVKTPTELWGHYCIELSDGRILDATASQFKGLKLPKVYLGDLPKGYTKLEPRATSSKRKSS